MAEVDTEAGAGAENPAPTVNPADDPGLVIEVTKYAGVRYFAYGSFEGFTLAEAVALWAAVGAWLVSGAFKK